MDTTWILIADRSNARVFENAGAHHGLSLVREIEHPEGRLQNREIGSDKPGRSFDSHGQGRHALGTEYDPSEHLAQQFAKSLAGVLEEGRTHHRFDRAVLVAEPRFLGLIKDALSGPTRDCVSATVNKDLSHVREHDLPQHLRDIVPL